MCKSDLPYKYRVQGQTLQFGVVANPTIAAKLIKTKFTSFTSEGEPQKLHYNSIKTQF
jgi:hypothetical protein